MTAVPVPNTSITPEYLKGLYGAVRVAQSGCEASTAQALDNAETIALADPHLFPPPPSGWAFEDDMQNPCDPPDPITGSWQPERYYRTTLTQRSNPNGAGKDMFTSVNAEHCVVPMKGVVPPMDLFACGPEYGETMHYMSCLCCMQDDTNLTDIGIRQPWAMPADGSAWECQFSADLNSRGEHDMWVAWAVSDTMAPGVYGIRAAFRTVPRNGMILFFNSGSPAGMPIGAANGVSGVMVYRNGVQAQITKLPVPGNGKFLTTPDVTNQASVKLFPDGTIEVWVSDAGMTDLRLIYKAQITGGLPLQTGYVHLQQAGYGPAKEAHDAEGVKLGDRTYHWHGVRFNGPVMPVQRLYSYPLGTAVTPGTSLPSGWQDRVGINLGYLATPTGKTFLMPIRDTATKLMFCTFSSAVAPWLILCNGTAILVPAGLSAYEWNMVEVNLPPAPNGYTLNFKPTANMVIAGLHLAG